MKCNQQLANAASVVVCCLALFFSPEARAQYRSNGISFEAGMQTHDVLPLTLGTLVASEAVRQGVYTQSWRLVQNDAVTAPESCRTLYQRGRVGPPCINNYFGITDGPYISVGWQRALGDLLLDFSEAPIISNLWFTWRSTLVLAATLPTRGWPMPAFMALQEWGLRWNMLDEKIRPFIAINGSVGTLVEPVGIGMRVKNNGDNCDRLKQGGELPDGENCVDTGNWVPQSPVPLNASTAVFTLNSFPPFAGLRPEAGIEYFFMEDVSMQLHASAQIMGSPVPTYLLRAPYAGLSVRTGASLVAYF